MAVCTLNHLFRSVVRGGDQRDLKHPRRLIQARADAVEPGCTPGGQFNKMKIFGAGSEDLFLVERQCRFGPVHLLWKLFRGHPKVFRIFLSRSGETLKDRDPGLFPPSAHASCSLIDSVFDGIESFLGGDDVSFSLDIVLLGLYPDFQQKVLRTEHGIPRGSVSTYKRIAARVGSRNGARAVGNALARNPFPIIVPCHRAIRSDGSLGGYQGGVDMKRTLLEMEGVDFDAGGRVKVAGFYY